MVVENSKRAESVPPRWWTRFSLRELLLAMTAICGFAAAFYSHWPFSPTAFLDSFRPRDILDPIVLAAHPVGLSYGSSGGGGHTFNGPSAMQHHILTYDVTDPSAEELLVALRDAVEKELGRQGCKIVGRSATSNEAFGFDYQKGAAIGFVWIYGAQASDRVTIGYLAFEHR